MKPDPERALRGLAMSLIGEVAPLVPTAFEQGTVRMAGMIAMHLAAEVDRLADRLLAENRAIVALAASAVPIVVDQELGRRLQEAGKEIQTSDMKVSTLLAANDRLRALLIDMHEAVESLTGEQARELDGRIWAELVESTRRRHVDLMV